jgi:N-methylhydantoinase A
MALSIVEIAVAKMSLAVRGVSVERGFDPRDFVMVGMGGAGPIHAVAIARQLHIPTVIIPVLPSHFSAFGMLMSDIRHDYVRTHLAPLPKLQFDELRKIFGEMLHEGERMLAGELVAAADMTFQRFLDLRYEGQEFAIKVPVSAEEIAAGDLKTIRDRFDSIHDRSFGHAAPDEPLEMVNVRLSARGIRQKLQMPEVSTGAEPAPRGMREVCLRDAERFDECPVYARDTLSAGAEISGPALIEEYGSTTVMFAGDHAGVSATGEIIIQLGALQ